MRSLVLVPRPAFPLRSPSRSHLWVRLSFGTLLLAIALPMLFKGPRWEAFHLAFDAPFRLLCHRVPERVISIAGVPMPLCSRCAGIWVGFSIGTLLAFPSFSMPRLRKVLLSASALLLVELVTQDLGLHPIWHATRFLTGALLSTPLGGTLGALITRELRDGIPAVEPAGASERT